ncbi:TetR/AcrR family transcriptional regulator [Anaerocolumna sp. AGMB13025]|uniref:TetR/AcrR family transcriptional regulator n=1 Tax=Anaerocolumna sp. AGMB13025 TaxID=3039116 RepID=UPI00241DEDB6|nr:TetR/AcrR family transcriptional regulator [Anaerocolumna sp. AGMB13025]WFR55468.1 TetR/AcrR family transcriptional regulator [Anaerocolumna sp. AGMB13025]
MEKKNLIRKSAIKVIARNGFHNANVKSIADEAGVAVGTVYLYFRNKEDILDYIFCVENKKRADFVNDLYEKGEAFEEVLEHFLDFHFECFKNDLDSVKVLYKEVITVDSFKDQQAQFYMDSVYEAFVKILKRDQLKGELKSGQDIGILATSIIFFLRIYSYNILSQEEAVDYDYLKRNLSEFILHGIKG